MLLLKQEQCAFCDQAEEILRRVSAEYPLSVTTADFNSQEGQQLALRAGMLFPPGVFFDGEPFTYGRLSERKLRREIERRAGKAQCQAGDTFTTPRRHRPANR
ncbi:MAG: thioredoxin family protein [Chloroflexota bacterium]|nr:thioredoxin family protein [Chloroflexota bacterium]